MELGRTLNGRYTLVRLLGAAEASPEGALFLSCHTGTFACGQ